MDVRKRIVIMGHTGVGKSSLANTILGEKRFKIGHMFSSETSQCQAETKSVNGRGITLVDTPGFFHSDRSEDELRSEIVRCITECAPGPHAFLIVLKVEKFTAEQEQEDINKVHQYFSEEVFKYATVVFTHGEQLPEGQTIEDFVHQNKFTSDLMKKCGGRCHVFDNKYWNKHSDYRSNQFQIEALLKSVDEVMMLNRGRCYTSAMLQAGNMSETETREQAKRGALMRLLFKLAGFAKSALLPFLFVAVPLLIFTRGLTAAPPVTEAEGAGTQEAGAVIDEAQSVLG